MRASLIQSVTASVCCLLPALVGCGGYGGPPAQAALMSQEPLEDPVFVVASEVHACEDVNAASAGVACPGGHRYRKGELVEVRQVPNRIDVWGVTWLNEGLQPVTGYVAQSGLAAMPDMAAFAAAETTLQTEVPQTVRIDDDSLNVTSLVLEADQLRGRKLFMKTNYQFFLQLAFDDDVYAGYARLPTAAGDSRTAPVYFRFKNATLRQDFAGGWRRYDCYGGIRNDRGVTRVCDQIMMVGELGQPIEEIAEDGARRTIPVFEIEAYADRFGLLRAEP